MALLAYFLDEVFKSLDLAVVPIAIRFIFKSLLLLYLSKRSKNCLFL